MVLITWRLAISFVYNNDPTEIVMGVVTINFTKKLSVQIFHKLPPLCSQFFFRIRTKIAGFTVRFFSAIVTKLSLFFNESLYCWFVAVHLRCRNSFSQLVGEEFLKYFDFTDEPLDVGLRRFLRHLTVFGDSQECDRLLGHFSHRYHQCNPAAHQSEGSVSNLALHLSAA